MNRTVAVIGGGPAGMSCSLWLHRLGLAPVLLERTREFGGAQNLSPFENIWFLGTRGKTGRELADQFGQHVRAELIPALLHRTIDSITKVPDGFAITAGDTEILARGVVIATGQRTNGVEAVESVPGSGDLLSSQRVCFNPGATATLGPTVSGAVVGVVGGGDNALVTALLLGPAARHVHLFIRSGMRAFEKNKSAVLAGVAAGWITLHQITAFEEFGASDDNVRVGYRGRDGQRRDVLVDHLCFRLGFTPNVEDVASLLAQGGAGSLERTASGHIFTEHFLRTSIPYVYAAGDVAKPRDPCVATAIADGAVAARSVEEDLYAAARHDAS